MVVFLSLLLTDAKQQSRIEGLMTQENKSEGSPAVKTDFFLEACPP